jgi:hypothetical protein
MRPDRHAVEDAGFLIVLGVVASYGFKDTFHGPFFLLAAGAGLLLGAGLAHLANVLRRPVVLLAAFTVAAFFLLGGAIALHADGFTAMLPLPHTLRQLADQCVHGWKDLLTTLAPVDNGPLLTLPYLMALVTGAAGMALAGRTRSPLWPLVAPAAYLAGVILLGIQNPARVAAVGAVFAVVSIGWIAVRSRRLRLRAVRGRAPRQRVAAVVLVAVAGVAATVVGPGLPGAGAHERVVFRSHVSPPFNVGEYPSPLAGFRKYTKGYQAKDPADHLYDQTVLKVSGLPTGTFLRFAALDDYNGNVWAAADQAPGTTGAAGAFQRVGSVIREDDPGKTYTARVTVAQGYDGQVWLPTAGALTELHFTDRAAADQSEYFRYNLATDTGIVPQGLRVGDTYTFSARVDDARVDKTMVPATSGTSENTSGVDFLPVATRWAGGASSPVAQVLAIAAYLHDQGRYTDGGPGEEQYAAGHSVARLSKFTADGQEVAGDDEQYAATLAILANQLGVPARVVVGAVVPADGDIKGSDVRAWVELRDQSGEWRTLPTEDFMSREHPPDNTPPQPQQLVAGKAVPPPAPVRPPSSSGDPLSSTANHHLKQARHHGHVALPGWLTTLGAYAGPPLGLIVLAVAGIVGAKELRRRRRRRNGPPAQRLSAAWRDLVDHARDLGHGITGQLTRREQAGSIGSERLTLLAREADRHVFGLDEPTDADAEAYWAEVDRARVELSEDMTRWQRMRARLSLTSFRKPMKEARA